MGHGAASTRPAEVFASLTGAPRGDVASQTSTSDAPTPATRHGALHPSGASSDTGRWRFLALLGMPALGITFGVTVVSTYAPVLIGGKSSPLLIGAVVGGEGFFGVFMPVFAGVASDRWAETAQQRIRLIVVAAGAAIAGLSLLALPGGLPLVAAGAALYFASHFTYLAPFQAMYADLVPDEASGRSRSAESLWRLAGAAGALIAGGFLITAWEPSPFIVGAGLIVVTTGVFARYMRKTEPVGIDGAGQPVAQAWRTTIRVLRNRDVRLLVAGNVLWNITLSALRAFVVLFFVIGLGRSASFVSGVIFPLVALGMAASAPVSGKLADRWGPVRLLQVVVPIGGLGLLLPAFSQAPWVLGCVPVVSAATTTVMVVPFAALMRAMPDDDHGAVSGVFTLSRGAGTMLGPLLAGGAIALLRAPMAHTHGYAGMWFVIGASMLASWPLLGRLRRTIDSGA